ncbi:hypothetical protein KSC_068300 [Ktedonobacter sp. SOSP1-52]|nr:hypothetical protein KSC_068300 [Ktedonobacter sp. SOSP1-52]
MPTGTARIVARFGRKFPHESGSICKKLSKYTSVIKSVKVIINLITFVSGKIGPSD